MIQKTKKESRKRRRKRSERKSSWQLYLSNPILIAHVVSILLLLAAWTTASFFEVIRLFALSLLFPKLVLPETSYPTSVCCFFFFVSAFLASSELEGKYFSFGRTWRGRMKLIFINSLSDISANIFLYEYRVCKQFVLSFQALQTFFFSMFLIPPLEK